MVAIINPFIFEMLSCFGPGKPPKLFLQTVERENETQKVKKVGKKADRQAGNKEKEAELALARESS